jgi:hypothetical protein
VRYALIRRDRPGRADQRAELQPAHAAYQEPFLGMIVYGGGLVGDDIDTTGDVDIRDVKRIEKPSRIFTATIPTRLKTCSNLR